MSSASARANMHFGASRFNGGHQKQHWIAAGIFAAMFLPLEPDVHFWSG
jgi:hypothetical protein